MNNIIISVRACVRVSGCVHACVHACMCVRAHVHHACMHATFMYMLYTCIYNDKRQFLYRSLPNP